MFNPRGFGFSEKNPLLQYSSNENKVQTELMKKNERNGWNGKAPILIVFNFNVFILAFLKASLSCSKKGDFNRGPPLC